MMLSRNRNARKWIMIVMTYYIVRATFIIFPWWEYNTPTQKNIITVQIVFMFGIFMGVLWSYKYTMSTIYGTLYL